MKWEERLAAEGLAPIDGQDLIVSRTTNRAAALQLAPAEVTSIAADVESWQSWARGVLETHRFGSPAQRRIWALYADGKSYREISVSARVSRSCVARVIITVKSKIAPGNPWRKSGRDEPLPTGPDPRVTARLLELAIECADVEALRARIAEDETLTQLNGGPMDPKKIAPMHRYVSIHLRNPVTIPGVVLQKDRLVKVDGRPHAGGIDIPYSGKDNSGNSNKPPGIVTVPWWNIIQATRETEVEGE